MVQQQGMVKRQGRVKGQVSEVPNLPGQQGLKRSRRWASPGQRMPPQCSTVCRRPGRQHSWEWGSQVVLWPKQGVLGLSWQEGAGQ